MDRYRAQKRDDGKWGIFDTTDKKWVGEPIDDENEATKVADKLNNPDDKKATTVATIMSTPQKSLKFVGADTLTGYGVVFDTTDLHGQKFTKDTEFHFSRAPEGMPVLWEHGQDNIKTRIGIVKDVAIDDVGHWYTIKLDTSNKYLSAIRELAKEGRIGLSTGTAPHLMKTADNVITEFGTAEVSLTICPAEMNTLGATVKNVNTIEKEKDDMPNERLDELERTIKALSDSVDKITGVIMNEHTAKGTVYSDGGEDDPNKATKNFADFLVSIKRGDTKRLTSVYNTTKGLDSTSGETGGYLVPDIFVPQLMMYDTEINAFGEQYNAFQIPMSSSNLTMPALNQGGTYTSGQSQYFGGVRFVSVGEGKSIPETEPSFERITFTATKQAGYVELTDELSQDSGIALERILTRLFGQAMAYRKMWLFLRGSGVGEPLGIYNSGLTVSVDITDASPTLAEFHEMKAPLPPGCYNSAYWFVHPFLENLMTSLVSGFVPYQTNLQKSPFGMPFNGRPIVVTDCVPSTIAGGGIGLFDLQYYGVGTRSGIEIAYSTDVGFLNASVFWRVKQRFDGRPIVANKVNISGGYEQSPFIVSS